MRFEIVQGDLEPDFDIELFDAEADDDERDVSDATAVYMRVELPNGTKEIWAAGFMDATTGKVRHVWLAGQTEVVGQYKAQVVLIRGNGEPQTFPSEQDKYLRWRVNPRLT